MRNVLIFFLIFISENLLLSQNFIYNGGFEEYNTLLIRGSVPPQYPLQYYVNGWYDMYSPDYFNIKSIDTFNSYTKIADPNSGNGHIGLRWSYCPTNDPRYPYKSMGQEATYQSISSKIQKDSTYHISFCIKRGSEIGTTYTFNTDTNYRRTSVNGFGVYFMTDTIFNLIHPPNFFPFNSSNPIYRAIAKPVLIDTNYKYTGKWEYLERIYTADSNYDYIVLDNLSDYSTLKIDNQEKLDKCAGYVFFDDIKVMPLWQKLITSHDTVVCKGDSITLSIFRGQAPFSWKKNNDTNVLSHALSYTYIPNNNDTFQVFSKFDTNTIIVKIKSRIDSILKDTTYNLCHENKLTLKITYLKKWYDQSTDSTKTFSTNGNYWYIQEPERCTQLKTNFTIDFCTDSFKIPNVFSPNGDGINDFFSPISNYNLPFEYEISVYNRFGQEIFNKANTPWDGRFNSVPQPNGLYQTFVKLREQNSQNWKVFEVKLTLIR